MFDDFFATSTGGTPALPAQGAGNQRLAGLIAGDATGPGPKPAPIAPPTTPAIPYLPSQTPVTNLVPGSAVSSLGSGLTPSSGGGASPVPPQAPLTGVQKFAAGVQRFMGTPVGSAVRGALTGLASAANPYDPGFFGSMGKGFVGAQQQTLQQQQVQYERQRQMQLDRLQQLIGGSEIQRNLAFAGMEGAHGQYFANRADGQYVRGGDGQLYWAPATGPDGGTPMPTGQTVPGPGGAPVAPPMVPVGKPRPTRTSAIDPYGAKYAAILQQVRGEKQFDLPVYGTDAAVTAEANRRMQQIYPNWKPPTANGGPATGGVGGGAAGGKVKVTAAEFQHINTSGPFKGVAAQYYTVDGQ